MSRAGTGARDQVARLLTLVPLLHARGDLPLSEAAAALGTSPQQVVKDLKVLWMCGLPGGFPDDLIDVDMDALTDTEADGTVRVWNADYLARPVRLAPTEASALIVALRTLRDTVESAGQDVVDRALSKLEHAAADGSGHQSVAVATAPTPGEGTVTALRKALAENRRLTFSYWVPTRDEQTYRTVDPISLNRVDGVDYLEAHCLTADDRRTFRVDRISDLVITPDAAEHHDGDAPGALTERLFLSDGAPVLTVQVAPPARWIASYYPIVEARELPDGHLEVDLAVQDPAWLRQLLLRLAPNARILDQDWAEDVRAEARRALSLYS